MHRQGSRKDRINYHMRQKIEIQGQGVVMWAGGQEHKEEEKWEGLWKPLNTKKRCFYFLFFFG